MKPLYRLSIAATLFVGGGLYWMHYVADYDRRVSDAYFNQLGLELTGHITAVHPVASDMGVIDVAVRQSNIPYYDPRRVRKFYFCVIKGPRAALVTSFMSELAAGDSVRVSCQADSLTFYRAGKLLISSSLHLYQFEPQASAITEQVKL